MIICFNSKSFLNLLSNIWQFSSLFDLVPGLEGLLFRVKASLPESAGASNSNSSFLSIYESSVSFTRDD